MHTDDVVQIFNSKSTKSLKNTDFVPILMVGGGGGERMSKNALPHLGVNSLNCTITDVKEERVILYMSWDARTTCLFQKIIKKKKIQTVLDT